MILDLVASDGVRAAGNFGSEFCGALNNTGERETILETQLVRSLGNYYFSYGKITGFREETGLIDDRTLGYGIHGPGNKIHCLRGIFFYSKEQPPNSYYGHGPFGTFGKSRRKGERTFSPLTFRWRTIIVEHPFMKT